MERGESSDVRVWVNVLRKDMVEDSGAWNAGDREGMILGVRTSTEGFGALRPLLSPWNGSCVRRGRKF